MKDMNQTYKGFLASFNYLLKYLSKYLLILRRK